MFNIKGIIRKDDINEFTKKDGSVVRKRIIYLEPEGSIFPLKIYIDDQNLEIGKVGESVNLNVNIYPFYFLGNKIKRASVNFYVSAK